jgi:hypothetical protein
MKRVFLIAGLATAILLMAVAAGAQTKPNFGGTWALDKAKSQGLSQRMQGADKVTWTIIQDGKTISIDSKVEGGQPPAGGGGGGMGGGRGMGGPQSYNLDGSEATSDINFGQATGKATSKSTWSGDTIELTRKSVIQGPNGEITSNNMQKLSLSSDGKVLTAVVHSESPRGTTDSTMVFNKQ